MNYRIHTDAVKENLILPELTPEQIACTYASEADLLNVALFGQTAKQWKNNNPGKKGNVRDDANLNQLLVLANMESYNAKKRCRLGVAILDRLFFTWFKAEKSTTKTA